MREGKERKGKERKWKRRGKRRKGNGRERKVGEIEWKIRKVKKLKGLGEERAGKESTGEKIIKCCNEAKYP